MLGVLEELFDSGLFDNLSCVHDERAVGYRSDDPEVVRNEDQGYTRLAAQFPHLTKYLRLNRHVQCRCRLIGDEHRGRKENAMAIITL